jgi:hypothetical protein
MMGQGMFFYDSQTSTLYLSISNQDTDPNPANHVVTIRNGTSIDADLSVASDASFITIQNIQIRNSNNVGISIIGENVTINNCVVDQAGVDGILIEGPGTIIANSSVTNSGDNNINSEANVVITNNLLQASFIYGCLQTDLYGTSILGTNLNMNCQGACVVSSNRIDSAGYIGISMGGTGCNVWRNWVSKACLVADDCGLVYWWGETTGGHLIQ